MNEFRGYKLNRQTLGVLSITFIWSFIGILGYLHNGNWIILGMGLAITLLFISSWEKEDQTSEVSKE